MNNSTFLILRAVDNTDAEDSSTTDDLSYMTNTYESSECSSSDITEEPVVTEQQLTELSNHTAGLEQKFLSALSFSVSSSFKKSLETPHECENSFLLETDSGGICEKRGAICHYVQSHHNEMILNQICVDLKSKESDCTSVSDNLYADHLPDYNWPVSGLLKNSDIAQNGPRSHPQNFAPEGSEMRFLKEDFLYYSKLFVTDNGFMDAEFGKGQYGNSASTSGSLISEHWKVNSHCNFLSINPALTKRTFCKLLINPGERGGTDYGCSLPYFDFSSVEDPWKVCLEKFSAGFLESSAAATSIKSDHHDQEHCNNDDMLIDKTKAQFDSSLSDLKKHSHEDSNLTLVSGGSSWESLLGRSSSIILNSVEDLRQNLLPKFEMPLDFIIDKCLLQEIMLQYPHIYAICGVKHYLIVFGSLLLFGSLYNCVV